MNYQTDTRLEGIVKTFIAAKGFGFIDGSDGRSYWFHQSQFSPPLDNIDTLDGALVIFDPTPGPKGYVAKRLSLAQEQATEWLLSEEFAYIKGDEPKRGRVVAITAGDISAEGSGDPDAVKAKLKALATSLGANALVDFRYEKTTGSRGNYNYTIHVFRGSPAILATPRLSSELDRVAQSERGCVERKVLLEQRYSEYLDNIRKQLRRTLILRIFILSVVGALISLWSIANYHSLVPSLYILVATMLLAALQYRKVSRHIRTSTPQRSG
jgi:cold shock CspA family protein